MLLTVLVSVALLAAFVLSASRTARRAALTGLVLSKVVALSLLDRLLGRGRTGPQRLREAFERLGPTYVKLGQLVASSEGLFPEAYCQEFSKCLDRVPPFPLLSARRTLHEELGRDPDQVFAQIEREPLASASIAQVHGATLRDGRVVVIKLQRPDLGPVVDADLRVLRVLASWLRRMPAGDMADLRGVVADFAANLAYELDFRREARNLDEFNAIMQEHGLAGVAAPVPIHELSGVRVLVMERFFGTRIDDPERVRSLLAGEVEEKLLLGMRAWFRCLLVHGFFHGDVHAGNLMALDDGRIGFLDFGIVGRFDDAQRMMVRDFLVSAATRNFPGLAKALVVASGVEGVDEKALASDLEREGGSIFDPQRPAKYADLLPVLTRASFRHRMRLARDLVLILKQMIYFDRYAKLLAPSLNIFADPRIIAGLMEDLSLAAARAR